AAAHFHDFFGRDENVVNLTLEIERNDAAAKAFRNFALKPRIRMNDVPKLRHELCASGGDPEMAEHPVQSHTQKLIDGAQVKTEEENRHNHDDSSANDFLAARPGNLFHFTPDIGV